MHQYWKVRRFHILERVYRCVRSQRLMLLLILQRFKPIGIVVTLTFENLGFFNFPYCHSQRTVVVFVVI